MPSVVKFSPGPQIITRTAGNWPVGDTLVRPPGLDLVGCQVNAAVGTGAFNGTTLTCFVEGTNNGTDFVTVYEGNVPGFTVAGTAMMGGTDQVFGIGQFDSYRFRVTEAGGAPTNGLLVLFSLQGDQDKGE